MDETFLIFIVFIVVLIIWKVTKKIEHSEYNKFVRDLKKAQQVVEGKILVDRKELNNLCSTIKWTLYVYQYDEKYMNNTSAKIFSQICSLQSRNKSEELQAMINQEK